MNENSRSAVRATGLTKTFPGNSGVHGIDLEVAPGTIFGFIGPSGSGKTTTIRLLTGITAPDSGDIRILDKDPARFEQNDRARLGYMPQLSVLYPHLTIWENMVFAASLFGMPRKGRKERIRQELEAVELSDVTSRKLGDASGGMQRRIALAATLVHDPDLLFLDEPTAGIDPILRRKVWDRLAGLRDEGRTLFITTQYVGEAAYCDQVGVLADGRLIAVDTPEGLRRQAYGGELLDVLFSEAPSAAQREELYQTIGATHIERMGARAIRLVVPDAGETAPQVTDWAASSGLEIESIEPYLPPFDDVFVELVGKLTDAAPSEGSPSESSGVSK